jgi:hypothetical protein
MQILKFFISGLLISAAALSCTHGNVIAVRQPAQETSEGKDPDEIEYGFFGPADRLVAIRNAKLINVRSGSDTSLSQVNIMQGPEQKEKDNQFQFDDEVHCKFTESGEVMGGKTPKFKCLITKVIRSGKDVTLYKKDGKTPVKDEIKVKFSPKKSNGEVEVNGEIYAEVAATRLFWALGYFADSVFPVRVICEGCPQDPRVGTVEDGRKYNREIDWGPALIERKYPGEKMTEYENEEQGWMWKEMAADVKQAPGVKDGLRLLAAFVGHGDAKPPQQRLVCMEKSAAEKQDRDQCDLPVEQRDCFKRFTNLHQNAVAECNKACFKIKVDKVNKVTTCDDPRMIVQDLGATFGGAGKLTLGSTSKANFEHWMNKKGHEVWADEKKCSARLSVSIKAKGAESNPVISEEGRNYLAARLCQLSDTQIADLFKAARVELLPEERGDSRSVEKWVAGFKKKVYQIADNQNCQPAVNLDDDKKNDIKVYKRWKINQKECENFQRGDFNHKQ